MTSDNTSTQTKAAAIIAIAGAAAVLALNVSAGWLYKVDCQREGGKAGECWDRGLAISGLGSGGPLAAALGIGGYVLGKGRGYKEGFWTLNPELHKDEGPTIAPSSGKSRA